MPSLDELEQDVARLTATYRNLTIAFEYHPQRVGINFQRAVAAVTRPPHDMGPIADQLAGILVAWDATRGSEPVPITPDGVGSLPMGIASAIGREIMEDFSDPKSPLLRAAPSASSTSSHGGSAPAASATAPTGPTSSSEPNGLASIRLTSADSPQPVVTSSGSTGSGS